MNLAYSQGGLKLEINIPPQHISAKSKGGLIIEGGVISSEYGNVSLLTYSDLRRLHPFCLQSPDMRNECNKTNIALLLCWISGLLLPSEW